MRRPDIVIAGGGLAGSTAAAMLGRAGIDAVLVDPHAVYPPDFRCEKLDGPQVQHPAQDRPRRRGAARGDGRSRMLGRALRPRGREAARRSARHSLRHAGQHDPRGNPAARRGRQRQGHRIVDQPRPPARHAVERRRDFGAAGGAGERPQYRLAPDARHRARGDKRRAIRSASASTCGRSSGRRFEFPRADLLSRSAPPTASPTSRCFRSAPPCAPT